MQVKGKVAVVTGAGNGIGAALAARLVTAGARVLVVDLDETAAHRVAAELDAGGAGLVIGVGADVADRERIGEIVDRAEADLGPVALYFANAGIGGAPGLDADETSWDRSLAVNLRAHVRAAQLLVPRWLDRGEGYFVGTASAAGLLTQIGSATYSVTKHAAVGFAEWLSVTYGSRGIRVSCLCPMGVNTQLLHEGSASDEGLGTTATRAVTTAGAVLEPTDVAEVVLAAIESEQFLILPHPEVLDMYRQKGADYDRWLAGMRRYQERLLAGI